MITIAQTGDLNWINLYRVAFQRETMRVDAGLLVAVDAAHARFVDLIKRGVPCYGVTTGLGKLVTSELDAAASAGLQANLLRARAVAIGAPFPGPVARAMMMFRLVNFLSGRSGVRADLCRFLVDRLNDDFTPWVPALGHGMAADTIANCHAFQSLIGEGFVYGPDGERQPAAEALKTRGVEPFELAGREGLALLNGVCAAPALALLGFYRLEALLGLANLVAAVSLEGMAAPKDALDPVVARVSSEPGMTRTVDVMRKHLNHSQIGAHSLQAPVSCRVTPQVHAAMHDALSRLCEKIEHCLLDCSDNPIMDGERLLSVGSFHNQHLVNQVEQVALALAHIGSLSERRLHRLLNADNTGLNAQLAARPGVDAGLVATQKASVDLSARLRVLAQPVSLLTGETSDGQEDYMSMAVPAIERLDDMARLCRALLAYELLAGISAVRMRDQRPGDGVLAVVEYFEPIIAPLHCDRSPAADVEAILEHFDNEAFVRLCR
ncbi:MAG: aromatic amino acid ammonia-lyase [Gammaproteobacteria bacterium]|nr:aromatic amino acid ammonia-lyase [Gammaproteobacteria bacterium]